MTYSYSCFGLKFRLFFTLNRGGGWIPPKNFWLIDISRVFRGGDQILIHHFADFQMFSSCFYLENIWKSAKWWIKNLISTSENHRVHAQNIQIKQRIHPLFFNKFLDKNNKKKWVNFLLSFSNAILTNSNSSIMAQTIILLFLES